MFNMPLFTRDEIRDVFRVVKRKSDNNTMKLGTSNELRSRKIKLGNFYCKMIKSNRLMKL
jgi:hypothetical protein